MTPDLARARRLLALAEMANSWAAVCHALGRPLCAVQARRFAETVDRLAIEAAAVPAWVPDRSKQRRA